MRPITLSMNCCQIVSICFYLNIKVKAYKPFLIFVSLYVFIIAEVAQRVQEEIEHYMSAYSVKAEETTSPITETSSLIVETVTSVNDSMYTITSTAAMVRKILI